MEELEIATRASDEEMPEEHGLPRPRFEELGGEFRVTLIGPGEQFMEGRAAPEWVRGLNERQVTAMEYVARQ